MPPPTSSRTASRPRSRSGSSAPATTVRSGRRRTLRVTSVLTPSRPSLTITRRARSGPAAPRDDADVARRAGLQDRLDLPDVRRTAHPVRQCGNQTAAQAEDVGQTLTTGVAQSIMGIDRDLGGKKTEVPGGHLGGCGRGRRHRVLGRSDPVREPGQELERRREALAVETPAAQSPLRC